jgi:hypothetical protein
LVCKNINPSPIKKIINKKVTQVTEKVRLPVYYCSLPIYCAFIINRGVFLNQNKKTIMKNRDQLIHRHREHHPQISIGLFLIALGLALLVATNDMLNLGSVQDYFTWETAMIFIGVLLLLNLHFTGGLVMIALGAWFLIDRLDYELPKIIKTIYWPSVVILIGLGFIISSLFKRKKTDN